MMLYLHHVLVKKVLLLVKHVHLMITHNVALHKILVHQLYHGKHILIKKINNVQRQLHLIIQLVQVVIHMFILILKVKVKILMAVFILQLIHQQ